MRTRRHPAARPARHTGGGGSASGWQPRGSRAARHAGQLRGQRIGSGASHGRGPFHRASPDAALRIGLAPLTPQRCEVRAGLRHGVAPRGCSIGLRHGVARQRCATGVASRHTPTPASTRARRGFPRPTHLAWHLHVPDRRPPSDTGRGRRRIAGSPDRRIAGPPDRASATTTTARPGQGDMTCRSTTPPTPTPPWTRCSRS